MDVALAADGDGIAEPPRDDFDRLRHLPPSRAERLERSRFDQRDGSEDGAGPRAKILCGKLAAADFAEILVDLGRADRLWLSVLIDVLK